MITKVPAFQTEDNQRHLTMSDALLHEFRLKLRGIFHTNSTNTTYNATQVAHIIANNSDSLAKTLSKYNKMINNALKKEKAEIIT